MKLTDKERNTCAALLCRWAARDNELMASDYYKLLGAMTALRTLGLMAETVLSDAPAPGGYYNFGKIMLDGKDISAIRENQLAAFRRDQLGFVFQDFNLLDTFSLKDNILLPLVLQGMNWREMEANLLPIANQLRIANLLEKYPYEVSGGQKQRAAVCRALITHPRLILADEPTGALDSRATDALLDVFQQINQTGQTLLMVTHSVKAASRAGRILFIRDGQVYHQLYRGEMTNEQFYEKISDALTVMTRKDAMDGEMA